MVLFVPEWNGPTEKAQDTAQHKGTCYICSEQNTLAFSICVMGNLHRLEGLLRSLKNQASCLYAFFK